MIIIEPASKIPGIIPAMNNRPTDTSDKEAYINIAIEGGIMFARIEEEAVSAAENCTE